MGMSEDDSMNRAAQPDMAVRPAAPLDADSAWRQVVARARDAAFFYGVVTTGVFCRPSCASRRPLRGNVRFFASCAAAEEAGFRACKRCKPLETGDARLGEARIGEARIDGARIDRVRAWIEMHAERPIRLAELGRVAGLSPFTVQRQFQRAMGVSPLGYQRALRAGRLRAALRKGKSVTEAIYDAGFGSSSRAYEGAALGMAPARFAQGGKGEEIGWCAAPSAFGWVMVGATARGLCWLSLAGTKADARATLRAEFPAARLKEDVSLTRWVEAALRSVCRDGEAGEGERGQNQNPGSEMDPVSSIEPGFEIDLRGTVFQLRVWNALRQIPRGETRSYSQLAREMGEPNATRAVARACAMNRVALVVPCHRVVGADGKPTGYRWGVERKLQLLQAEKDRG